MKNEEEKRKDSYFCKNIHDNPKLILMMINKGKERKNSCQW
jgi:hypothetical protein